MNVWRRWTDAGDVPFHEYCELKPSTLPPPFGDGDGYPEEEEPPLSYTPPVARWALRHTPLLVLVATFSFALVQFGRPALAYLTGLFAPTVTPITGVILLVVLAWVLLQVWIVRNLLRFPGSGTVKAVVVYGLLGVLTAGLVLGMYAATPNTSIQFSAPVADAIRRFPFAFLWMLLVGGHLVYDGMLRTENMFDTLGEKRPPIVDASSDYAGFLADLKEDLDDASRVGARLPPWLTRYPPFSYVPAEVKTAYLFAVVFVAPFFLFWWLVPTGMDPIENVALRGVVALLPATLDVFLVVVFFQFLVLVAYFNRLLTDPASGPPDRGGVSLTYNPDHHDGYAGFGDLGSFATRVNVLLVVGGIYLAYHLYVRGFRTAPNLANGVTVDVVSWGFSTLFPLLTYGFAVVVWLYLSFWQIHKAMRRGRERKLEEAAGNDEYPGLELRNGPVWPVDGRRLVSIVSMDLVPLLTLLPFVRL